MLKSQVNYQLESVIKYPASDGIVNEAKFIALYPPTVRSLKDIAPIKQMFMRVMMNMGSTGLTDAEREAVETARTSSSTKVEVNEAEMFCQAMAASEEDYTLFLNKFQQVLLNTSVAKIDGEQPVTDSFMHQLQLHELEALAGEYLSNFIAPSAMKD